MRRSMLFGLAATIGVVASGSAYAADAAAGEKVFKKYCAACHSIDAGRNRVGPSLNGVIGRASAAVPAFAYSAALKRLNVTWT